MSGPILAAEVRRAIADGRPVVALESTIVAHGMPFPENLRTARALERAVREAGAVPATIAVMDGRLCAGLDDAGLERLATEPMAKASARDLGVLAAGDASGATTVAATMVVASMAGIDVFATGGIGGVHRGASRSFDVSADLTELARTRVAVVCAGAKAILDIPATLEVLETLSVPVMTYRADEFPAFYSRSSGLPSPVRVEDPEEVARICLAHWSLPGSGGALLANPIPAGDEVPSEAITATIEAALADAEREGVAGPAITPFLLARVAELTGARSLAANVALAVSNASLAAGVAVALSRLRRSGSDGS